MSDAHARWLALAALAVAAGVRPPALKDAKALLMALVGPVEELGADSGLADTGGADTGSDLGPEDTGGTDSGLGDTGGEALSDCWELRPFIDLRMPLLAPPPNVLVVVLDDVGVDVLSLYGASPAALTPRLDELGATGAVFDSAYASPVCSPTRAELMTGVAAPHHGVDGALAWTEDHGLACEHVTLPEALREAGYTTAAFGKWHLDVVDEGGIEGARIHGFDRFAGTVGNLSMDFSLEGEPQGYLNWERIENGSASWSSTYATTKTIDDAADWIADTSGPWFAYVALHAGHAPYHSPPEHLLSGGALPPAADEVTQYLAMLEAADTEVGRLLDGLGSIPLADTLVVVVGDNGSPDDVVGGYSKGTVFEAGVHVPMIFNGPGVTPGGRLSALAQVADISATVLASAYQPPLHATGQVWEGVSLSDVLFDATLDGPRTHASNGVWHTNYLGEHHIEQSFVREARWKLIRRYAVDYDEDSWALYDMDGDGEDIDLVLDGLDAEERAAFNELVAIHDEIWPPVVP